MGRSPVLTSGHVSSELGPHAQIPSSCFQEKASKTICLPGGACRGGYQANRYWYDVAAAADTSVGGGSCTVRCVQDLLSASWFGSCPHVSLHKAALHMVPRNHIAVALLTSRIT